MKAVPLKKGSRTDRNAASVYLQEDPVREETLVSIRLFREGKYVGVLTTGNKEISRLRHLMEEMGPEIPKMLNDIELNLDEADKDN